MSNVEFKLISHLEKLPYFIGIAEAGSLRSASLQLHVSQPSLSKALQILEECTGTQLFFRHKRGVELTGAGRKLLDFAYNIAKLSRGCEESLHEAKKIASLGLATHEILVPLLVPELVKDLKREHNVDLKVFTNPSVSHLLQRVENFDSDFSISAYTGEKQGLEMFKLFSDSYGFFASPNFIKNSVLKNSTHLFIKNIRALPIILAPHVLAGSQLLLGECLLEEGLDLRPMHEVGSIESVAALVAADLGIGLLPLKIGANVYPGKLKPLPYVFGRSAKLGEHDFICSFRRASPGLEPLIKKIRNLIKGILASPARTQF